MVGFGDVFGSALILSGCPAWVLADVCHLCIYRNFKKEEQTSFVVPGLECFGVRSRVSVPVPCITTGIQEHKEVSNLKSSLD